MPSPRATGAARKRRKALSSTAMQLAADIRCYCDANPHARDSLDGIAWWLTWQRFGTTKRNLQGAIKQLVAEGVLKPHQLADGSTVFGCPQSAVRSTRSGKVARAKAVAR